MDQSSNNFVIIALQLFLGELVLEAEQQDDAILFVTSTGDGFMGPNSVGNWDIWLDGEVVYEVESELYEVIQHRKDEHLIELYDYMKMIDPSTLKFESQRFLEVVQVATENVILNYTLPLKGQVKIGEKEVIYKNNKKVTINLN